MFQDLLAPNEAARPERALNSVEGSVFWYERKTDWVAGTEKGEVDRKPVSWDGEVPGENPFMRDGLTGEDRGGDPTGPKSME